MQRLSFIQNSWLKELDKELEANHNIIQMSSSSIVNLCSSDCLIVNKIKRDDDTLLPTAAWEGGSRHIIWAASKEPSIQIMIVVALVFS